MRPKLGLKPTRPVCAAGMRIEPPPSLPWLNGSMPAAVSAAAPPDEPPGVWPRFHGLRVTPCKGESVSAFQPNSGVVVLPSSTAPPRSSRSTTGALSSAGASSVTCEPRRVGQPLTEVVSLMVVGTPSSGDSGASCRQRRSDVRAAERALSSSIRTKALRNGWSCRARASIASTTSTGESARRR